MDIQTFREDELLTLELSGRFDAYGSGELNQVLEKECTQDIRMLLLDMTRVSYLSSAGLRVLLVYHKKLSPAGGQVTLAGLQEYCAEVIQMTGFGDAFPAFDTVTEARGYCRTTIRERQAHEHWDSLETEANESGSFRFIPLSDAPGSLEILGDIRDILHSSVTSEKIYSKRFFDKEYSIGMGGLGAHLEDYINLLGEMITVGGTMVWLPTDGHDTADFLIPRTDQGDVMLRTGFNVSVKGGFNELIHFISSEPEGTSVGTLYRQLFAQARKRRPDYRGSIAIAMRAQLGRVYGSGIKKSAVTHNAPANGKMILHESNIGEWFDSDTAPRHTDVTGLVVGLGADLTADLSDYNEEDFNRVFYLHPVNIGGKQELLHNHAVIFNKQPLPEQPTDLEQEIKKVIQEGTFMDMRHLLDTSTVTAALIGVNYVQAYRSDPDGIPVDILEAPPRVSEAQKNKMKYYKT
jgi:anti-anti-sigma factor